MTVKRRMATSCQSSSSGADDHDRDTEAHKSEETSPVYGKVPLESRQERGGRGRPRAQKNRPVTSRGLGGCEGGRAPRGARGGLKVDDRRGRGSNGELDGQKT